MGEIILSRSNVTDEDLWELYGTMAGRIVLSETEVTDTNQMVNGLGSQKYATVTR